MRLNRDDRGATLIEIMIAIALLGLIIGPLTAGLILYIRNTNETNARMAESHDIQIASAYFGRDVQSIGTREWTAAPYDVKQSIETNVAASGGIYRCGSGTTPALVRFAWDNPLAATGTPEILRVSYVVQTVGAETQLRRVACDASGAITSETVLVHNLVSAAAPTCYDPAGTTEPCTAPAVPAKVTLTLTIKASGNTGSPITITLVGQRRQT